MSLKPKSYASVEAKLHPLNDDYFFTNTDNLSFDNNDSELIEDINQIVIQCERCFASSTGEWKYLDSQKRSAYIGLLKAKCFNTKQKAIFTNMFRNDATYGIMTPSYPDLKMDRINSQILSDLDTCIEFCNLYDYEKLLYDPSVGNPYGLIVSDKVLMPDTPRHYYFAHKIKSLLKVNFENFVLEVGGGYGGLALMLQRVIEGQPYINVDLFETCLLQYYFLKKSGLNPKFITTENEKLDLNRINIIPTIISEKILNKIDNIELIFNSRSFCEMGEHTVNNYFAQINNYWKPNVIYHENSNFLLFPDSERHIEILGKDFPIDTKAYNLEQMTISPFLGGNGRYREFIYKRHEGI